MSAHFEDGFPRYKRLCVFDRLHMHWITSITFSPDQSLLATAGADGALFIIDINQQAPIACLRLEHPLRVHSMIWPRPACLIIGRSDGGVQFLQFNQQSVSFSKLHAAEHQ